MNDRETARDLSKRLEKAYEEIEDLKRVVQSQNMKINAAKGAKNLSDRGLLPYCNAPYPD